VADPGDPEAGREDADAAAEGGTGVLEVCKEQEEDQETDRQGEEGDVAVHEKEPVTTGASSSQSARCGEGDPRPVSGGEGDFRPAMGDVQDKDEPDREPDCEFVSAVCEAGEDGEAGEGDGVWGEGGARACGRVFVYRSLEA